MEHATGEFRLVRQGGGRGAYAHVRVEVRPAARGAGGVHWSVEPGDQASAQPERDPHLVRAAVEGVQDAVRQLGAEAAGRDVHITFMGMNFVDTEPTAVRAAAAAATAAALGRADRFRVVYDDGWHFRPVG
jgi:hypothetical protein